MVKEDIIHLYQSEYAKQHLIANGATHIYEMTEYISNPPVPDESIERSIDVLFNPLKGVHYTDEIRKRSDAVMQFRPIGEGPGGHIRISPEQVRELLQRAKIYIDFGPHPGMDRLPREAALAGVWSSPIAREPRFMTKTYRCHQNTRCTTLIQTPFTSC
jgi:hypothetical protein